jgi:hypothetical protein
LEVEIINCPSCGKQTFKREFCIFCGKKIRESSKKAKNSYPGSDNEFDKFQVEETQQKLKSIIELKNKIEKEIEELNNNCNYYRNQRKKSLSDIQNKQKNNKKKIKELLVLLKLEEISKTDFTEQKEILTSEIEKEKKAIKEIKEELKEIRKIKEKIQKITLNQSFNKKKIKQKLVDLELAYKNNQITNQIYIKLKTKYEKQIKK